MTKKEGGLKYVIFEGVEFKYLTISLAKKEMISMEDDLILQFLSWANSVKAGTIC